jgi:hypothetical protein
VMGVIGFTLLQTDLPPLFEQATPYNSLGALVF